MDPLTHLGRKLSLFFHRQRFARELDEEIAFHREQTEKELIAEGMTAAAARHAAMRRFGNSTRVKEESHQVVGFRFEDLWQDLRYAFRQIMRSPGFAAAVFGTLTLGIGATTAVFTLIYGTLLRSLPYPEADRIVSITDVRLQGQSTGGLVGMPRFFDLSARSKSLQSAGFFYFDDTTLIDGAQLPVSVKGAGASAGLWQVFAVQPMLGRVFDERDDQPKMPGVAVLSYSAWQRVFGGNPGVIGRQVTIEQEPTTIIGVMPPSFNVPSGIDLWRPAHFTPATWAGYRGDGTRFINVFARLAPGVSIASAKGDLRRVGEQLRREHAGTDENWQFNMVSLREARYGELRPALLILFVASAFLLLVACLNVANLLLTRATAREREVALRRALGASEGRIRLQLLAEGALLALAGGFGGLALTCALVGAVAARLPGELGTPGTVAVYWPVALFAFVLAVVVGLVFGFAPALHGGRGALNLSLKQGERQLAGSGGGAARNVLMAVQVGLSLVLLVGATLLGESLWKLVKSPLGFNPDHLLTFRLVLPWNADAARIRNFYQDVQRRVEALPGVIAVGQTSAMPTEDWHSRSAFDADWLPPTEHRDAINAETRSISGDFLPAIGTPLLSGRDLQPGDAKVPNKRDAVLMNEPVLVNRAFTQRYFAGGNLLGRHLTYAGGSYEIVGVVGDVRGTSGSVATLAGPEIYFPADGGYPISRRTFVVRSRLPPEQLIGEVREQVHKVDPQEAVANIVTMDKRLDESVAQPRLSLALVAAFALIALLLACVGVYGVVAWSVARRIQEIGVRMALGASRGSISLLFARRAIALCCSGLAGGTIASLLLARLLRSQLYGVAPDDPRVYAISIGIVLLAVLVATLRPARAAASVNPMQCLRSE